MSCLKASFVKHWHFDFLFYLRITSILVSGILTYSFISMLGVYLFVCPKRYTVDILHVNSR